MPTGIPIDGADRQSITIKGVQLTVFAPFKEGHPLRANEASVLNQTYGENMRNNLAKEITKAVDEAGGDAAEVDLKGLQAQVDGYANEYDFGVRRLGVGPVDPVEKEALRLAKEQVRDAFKAKGYNLKEVGAEVINARAAEAVEKYPQFRELAGKNVKAKVKIAADVIGDLQADAS